MFISSRAAGMLLTLALPVALIATPRTAAAHNGAAVPLRITEITESSHPFQTLYCAREPIRVRFFEQFAEVVVANESRTLIQAWSASGARYVAPGDESTELWNKGALATVTWSGQELPLCAPSGAIIPPYLASGNEPFWAVTYDGWTATLKRPGEPDLSHSASLSDTPADGQSVVAADGADAFRLEVVDALCVDDMSGMPRPQKATLYVESDVQHGCGGSPERLLQGETWRVTHIAGKAADDAAEAHIRFLANGTVVGSTGCNRFFGQYTLTGETLQLTNMGSTRMACPAGLMSQEATLLKMLADVSGFSFQASDLRQLRLHAGDDDSGIDFIPAPLHPVPAPGQDQ